MSQARFKRLNRLINLGNNQINVFKEAQGVLEKEIASQPPEAQAFYNKEMRDLNSAQRSGDSTKIQSTAEALQKRMQKMKKNAD